MQQKGNNKGVSRKVKRGNERKERDYKDTEWEHKNEKAKCGVRGRMHNCTSGCQQRAGSSCYRVKRKKEKEKGTARLQDCNINKAESVLRVCYLRTIKKQ